MVNITRSLLTHLIDRATIRAGLDVLLFPLALDYAKRRLRHFALHPELDFSGNVYNLQTLLIEQAEAAASISLVHGAFTDFLPLHLR